jgi:arabinogalactan oligomer/maltooligosaccharide transport system substrate-binding protein
MKNKPLFWFLIWLAIVSATSSCGQATEVAVKPTQLFPVGTLLPTSTYTLAFSSPSLTPLATSQPASKSPEPTSPVSILEDTPTSLGDYPGPSVQSGADVYPPPINGSGADVYPAPQQQGLAGFTQTPTAFPGTAISPSPVNPTLTPQFTPTEGLPQPFGLIGTPSTAKVSIFHSWTGAKQDALIQIIQNFQESYPDVTFDLTYIPESDLLERYLQAAYNGGGPDLLLGDSDWRSAISSQGLAEDLNPYISTSFRELFSPVALETGQYKGIQVCLPYDLRGVLLYRNKALIPEAPKSFEQLVSLAQNVKGIGTLGVYFEGGSYFSLGHLMGLGGQLLDNEANPLFDRDQYRAALAWMNLLKAMKQAGALDMNGDKDLQLFKDGKSGFLVEGSWTIDALVHAIGEKNLAIDPWPTYLDGHLSGFVQSDCIFLNANTQELSSLDHQGALQFIGYFLTPPVQERLADAGIIPALITSQPSPPLTRQAMLAFQGGTAYPVEFDDTIRQIYFTALDNVITKVVNQGIDPRSALQEAFEAIQKRLSDIRSNNQ